MNELIAKLVAATGPDLDLDHAIAEAIKPEDGHGVLLYTASLDAALTLVPEPWRVNRLSQDRRDGTWYCSLQHPTWRPKHLAVGMVGSPGEVPTAALAVCMAALVARTNQPKS